MTESSPPPPGRGTARLNAEAIVAAAIGLADDEGLAAVSMRRLGDEFQADPMAFYRHVGSKDKLLGTMADRVVASIPPAPADGAWTDRLLALIMGARYALIAHPWVPSVLTGLDAPPPAALRHLEQIVGVVRDGGMSIAVAHHVIHLLGSRAFGFSQDLFDDKTEGPAPGPAFAEAFPRLAELAEAVRHDGPLGGCDDDAEFEFAVRLMIDGLSRSRRE